MTGKNKQRVRTRPTCFSVFGSALGGRAFWRARDGSGAVEMALLAPVMIFFMMASFVVFDTTRALGQMAVAANTVADLATRVFDMDDARGGAFIDTAEAILSSYAGGSTLDVSVTSVANDLTDGSDTALEVVWSVSNDAAKKLTNADLDRYALPSVPDGESIILVVVEMDYAPVFRVRGIAPSFRFEEVAVRRPRFVDEVCFLHSDGRQDCSDTNNIDGVEIQTVQ